MRIYVQLLVIATRKVFETSQNLQETDAVAHNPLFYKKNVLKHFAKFTGKHVHQSLFLINLEASETLAQVFWNEFCEIFRKILFYRTPLVATSEENM